MMPSPDMSFPVPLIHISETNSTNSYLQTLCAKQQGVAAFTTVVADFQTSGRGQRGNSWESEPKKNLLFSFVLFPDFLEARRQFLISQIVSLAIKEELDSYADDFSIKWPNDIYWKDKKICGMLIENDLMGRNISQSISGIGINVNTDDFPVDIASVATSMHVITGAYYKRAEIIADIWKAFEKYYDFFVQTENLVLMVDTYNQRLVNMDRRVMIEERGHQYEGTARGIDAEGGLLVERDDGTTTSVISGEVSVRGILGYV